MPSQRPLIVVLGVRRSVLCVTIILEVARTSGSCESRIAHDVDLPSGAPVFEIWVSCLRADAGCARVSDEIRGVAIHVAWPVEVSQVLAAQATLILLQPDAVDATLGILTGTVLSIERSWSFMGVEEASDRLGGDASCIGARVLRLGELQLGGRGGLVWIQRTIEAAFVGCAILLMQRMPFVAHHLVLVVVTGRVGLIYLCSVCWAISHYALIFEDFILDFESCHIRLLPISVHIWACCAIRSSFEHGLFPGRVTFNMCVDLHQGAGVVLIEIGWRQGHLRLDEKVRFLLVDVAYMVVFE